jgi:hypothetical protein
MCGSRSQLSHSNPPQTLLSIYLFYFFFFIFDHTPPQHNPISTATTATLPHLPLLWSYAYTTTLSYTTYYLVRRKGKGKERVGGGSGRGSR